MNRTSSILILAMLAGTALAQMPATAINNAKGAAAQMNSNAAKTNAALPSSNATKAPAQAPVVKSTPAAVPQHPPAAMPAANSVKPAASAASSSAPAKKAAAPMKAKAAAKPAEKKADAPAKPAEDASAAAAPEMNSKKRDPFVSPIVSKVGGPTNCSGGKKCLVIDQVALRGVVRSQNGMIAVIVNAANKAYFMRENDPVYNGFVVKITPDSIVFRETVTDRLGKTGTREVVKKVNAPVV